MKKTLLILAGACLLGLLAPSAAIADKQPDIFAQYHGSDSGSLTSDEIAAIRKDYAANPDGPLKKYDKDHDGKLSDEEIAAIKPHKHKKKKHKSDDEGNATGGDSKSSAPTDGDKPAASTNTSTPDADSNASKPDAANSATLSSTDSNQNK